MPRRMRRTRRNWPLILVVASLVAAWGLYLVLPVLWDVLEPTAPAGFAPRSLARDSWELLRERATTTLTSLWFFVFGATIGSFLNVVAYRMPMGLTIVSKPSRCPYCMQPIRFTDNVPLLGWIALRGRCRACRLPISIRYPMVELLVATLFFSYFIAELASGGANLPIREPNSRQGIMWNVLTPQADLISIYAYHCFLLSILVTLGLIKLDRLRIPLGLVCFAIAVGLVCPLVWPHLSLVPWASTANTPVILAATFAKLSQFGTTSDRVITLITGWVIGTGLGAVLDRIVAALPTVEDNPSKIVRSGQTVTVSVAGSTMAFGLVGLFLGWQAIAPCIFLGAATQGLVSLTASVVKFEPRRWWCLSWLVGVWATVCFWRQLPTVWLPGATSHMLTHLVWVSLGNAMVYLVDSTQSDYDVHRIPKPIDA